MGAFRESTKIVAAQRFSLISPDALSNVEKCGLAAASLATGAASLGTPTL
jgi:hypothetical protein